MQPLRYTKSFQSRADPKVPIVQVCDTTKALLIIQCRQIKFTINSQVVNNDIWFFALGFIKFGNTP